jgi:hypothetical protein
MRDFSFRTYQLLHSQSDVTSSSKVVGGNGAIDHLMYVASGLSIALWLRAHYKNTSKSSHPPLKR